MNWTAPVAEQVLQADAQAVWHPFTPLYGLRPPLEVVRTEGAWLYTADGRQILDAISSWWVNLHGHSHPYIAQAISEQAASLAHVIFAGFTHQPAVTLAERLLRILPPNMAKIFYSDNGSTATEVAMKMAFQYFYNLEIYKPKIIAIDGAYHGDTFGAMSVGDRSPFNAPFQPYLFEAVFIPFPDQTNQEKVFQEFADIIATGQVGAFIFEPLVQGASGMRMYSASLLDKMIAHAQQHGVICIADEVMTGFGRTGKLFASLYLHHYPDIICLSKGITGGFLPLGVTACTQRIQNAYRSPELMKTFFHGHSYTANPIACAAANASLDLLLSQQCSSAIARINHSHLQFAAKLQQGSYAVRNVRVLGTILAVEIDRSGETSYFHEARNNLYYHFLDKNLLMRPLGNVVYILPPYCITNQELALAYQAILEIVE
ncbi:MAG: adenosylmethionine--8-amino-7-oxononanoate transaminase [Cytophagales bacterium]|nr:adenosylmethionine--8-amino-7-oxononanoate transaminase [Bernardetiaceae bacterium]MDW8203488.1 adenosylmethionine--8-amino-7-oxononanoate transaminase [Cytophagales bacterium]